MQFSVQFCAVLELLAPTDKWFQKVYAFVLNKTWVSMNTGQKSRKWKKTHHGNTCTLFSSDLFYYMMRLNNPINFTWRWREKTLLTQKKTNENMDWENLQLSCIWENWNRTSNWKLWVIFLSVCCRNGMFEIRGKLWFYQALYDYIGWAVML